MDDNFGNSQPKMSFDFQDFLMLINIVIEVPNKHIYNFDNTRGGDVVIS